MQQFVEQKMGLEIQGIVGQHTAIGAGRSLRPIEIVQHPCAIFLGRGMAGHKKLRALEMGQCVGEAALGHFRDAQMVFDLSDQVLGRGQFLRARKQGLGLVIQAQIVAGRAKPCHAFHGLGDAGQNALIHLFCRFRLTQGPQAGGQPERGIDEIRAGSKHFAIVSGRGFCGAFFPLRGRQIIKRCRLAWLVFQHFAEQGFRFVVTFLA